MSLIPQVTERARGGGRRHGKLSGMLPGGRLIDSRPDWSVFIGRGFGFALNVANFGLKSVLFDELGSLVATERGARLAPLCKFLHRVQTLGAVGGSPTQK